MSEKQQVHPGQLPYMMANLRKGVITVCSNSKVHPAIVAVMLRELASQFDAQTKGMLDSFLQQVKKKEKGGGENKPD